MTTCLDRLASDHDAEILKFDGFGKAFMKGCKCSPDAFMQMSLQLAFYRCGNHADILFTRVL